MLRQVGTEPAQTDLRQFYRLSLQVQDFHINRYEIDLNFELWLLRI
jgi:hypothetical protein